MKLRDYIARLNRVWIEGQVVEVSRRSGSQVYVTVRDVDVDASVSVVLASSLPALMGLLLWLMAFVAGVGIVARDQVVDLLFGWGFDDAALAVTAAALGVFLLGLPAHAMNVILARAFYSGKDTVTPVTVAIASVGVNVAVSVATVGTLGVRGLALGIAVGAWFEAATLLLLLRRRHAGIVGRPIVSGAAWSLVGAVMSALVAAGLLALDVAPAGLARIPSLLLELSLAAGAGLVTYVLYSRVVRLPELDRALDIARAARRGR